MSCQYAGAGRKHPFSLLRIYEPKIEPFLNQAAHFTDRHFQFLRQYLSGEASNTIYKPEELLDSTRLRIPNIVFELYAGQFSYAFPIACVFIADLEVVRMSSVLSRCVASTPPPRLTRAVYKLNMPRSASRMATKRAVSFALATTLQLLMNRVMSHITARFVRLDMRRGSYFGVVYPVSHLTCRIKDSNPDDMSLNSSARTHGCSISFVL